MTFKPWLVACIAVFAASSALAQSSPAKPLNLDLPLQFTPAAASTTHGTAKSAPTSKPRQHGAHPDDIRDTGVQLPYANLTACNNQAYKRPRVFGNVALGAFSGSHIEGNYQAGTVSIAKSLGSCSHPSGGIIFNFGFSRQTINGSGWPPDREP
ncbi:MAG: hypothetical protein WCB49_03975 [Gammaproteobacteria bacterium]